MEKQLDREGGHPHTTGVDTMASQSTPSSLPRQCEWSLLYAGENTIEAGTKEREKSSSKLNCSQRSLSNVG
jgi:hypothetical protein